MASWANFGKKFGAYFKSVPPQCADSHFQQILPQVVQSQGQLSWELYAESELYMVYTISPHSCMTSSIHLHWQPPLLHWVPSAAKSIRMHEVTCRPCFWFEPAIIWNATLHQPIRQVNSGPFPPVDTWEYSALPAHHIPTLRPFFAWVVEKKYELSSIINSANLCETEPPIAISSQCTTNERS
jgi:hypothetical protein